MSNSTNLPPPPPALCNLKNNQPRLKKYLATQATFCNIDECTWADAWPELQKACYINKVCSYQPPKACRYKNILGILQEGPTCGLTVLSMILGGTPAAEDLLKTAKQLKYTNNGEMFSAKNLFQLICDTVAAEAMTGRLPHFECQMFEGQLNCAKVRDCLLNGACIFVAYPF